MYICGLRMGGMSEIQFPWI